MFLPFREVGRVAHGLADFPCDVQQVGLPRQPRGLLAVSLKMPSALRGIIYDIFGEVLNIAGVVVYPRQGDILIGVIAGIPGIGGRYLRGRGCRGCAEV